MRAAKHHELNVVRAASGLCVVPDDRVIRHLGGVVRRDPLVPLGHFLKQKLLEVHMKVPAAMRGLNHRQDAFVRGPRLGVRQAGK